jgi:hypothetical protein
MTEVILIDFFVYSYSIAEVLGMVSVLKRMMPNYEIYLDGDRYALVGRRKEAVA